MVLNNKDLKIALKHAREQCPNKDINRFISRETIMLTDILLGNRGVIKMLKKALPLMNTWDTSLGKAVKDTFNKYITQDELKIN